MVFGMSETTVVVVTALIYAGYFVAGLVALVLLGTHPSEAGALEYAYLSVFVTCGLHFGWTAFCFCSEGKKYKLFPVAPKWLFFFGDMIMAMALGVTIAAYVLDHDNRTPVAIGNAAVMGTQLICAWKTYVLLFPGQPNRAFALQRCLHT